ncbi:MAG TPA: DUF4097 family beta strand repeat-containing protein [Steroidobacteraceae bacterium]|nr:DUF4097 family beta strand repeat-containing protein [Steroidobacteraceae bacterium]
MRSRQILSTLTLLAFIPASTLAWGDDCKFSADRTGGVDAKGVEKVVLRTGAGDLTVIGGDRNVRIEARGKACAASQELLDQTQITVRRDGNVVYVETAQVMEKDGWSLGHNDYAYIDAGIALPSNIPVEAIDSSGDAKYEGLQSLALQDSSGDLEVRRIAGTAVIGDSSGDLEVRDVGSVKLNDSSGDIEVDEVRGDVEVDNDSSGDIRITGVRASVMIRNDSSGGIRIEDVKGNVVVENDSSGDIYAGRVTGDFTVNGDSSGSIEHESIGGKITIPSDKKD